MKMKNLDSTFVATIGAFVSGSFPGFNAKESIGSAIELVKEARIASGECPECGADEEHREHEKDCEIGAQKS